MPCNSNATQQADGPGAALAEMYPKEQRGTRPEDSPRWEVHTEPRCRGDRASLEAQEGTGGDRPKPHATWQRHADCKVSASYAFNAPS